MKFDVARFKNYSLWVALFALLGLVLPVFGVAIVPVAYAKLTTSILSILVGLGVISNPLTTGITDKVE